MDGTPIYHQLITFRLVLTARLDTGIVNSNFSASE